MKICTKCHQLKPLEDFNRDKTNPTGYKSRCRECSRQDRQTETYREYSRKQVAKWRQTEKGKEYNKKYNLSDEQRERKRAWKKTEAGKVSEKKYNRSERKRELGKRARETNPKWIEYQRRGDKKYRTNPKHIEKIRARKAVWYAVKVGKIPHISTVKCSKCQNRAVHYHHHNGYSKDHKLDVIPLCQMCHEVEHYD